MSYIGEGYGGARKRGREYDDSASEYSSPGNLKQRRFDLDQPLGQGPGWDRSGGGGERHFSGGYRRGGGGGGGGRGPRQSYGGGRRNYDRGDASFAPLLSTGEKYCINLWKFGDDKPENAGPDDASMFTSLSTEDLEGLKEETRGVWAKGGKDDVLRGFRIIVSEAPHKLPYIATLLGLLARQSFTAPALRQPAKPLVTLTGSDSGPVHLHDDGSGDADMSSNQATPQIINLGLEIVRHLVKVFQNHLDARRWRSARFYLHLFAHLASLPKPLIDLASLVALLHQSFVSALENELGLRAERGDELVRVVLETLLRLDGVKVEAAAGETLQTIRAGIDNYMANRRLDYSFLGGESGNEKQWQDPIEQMYRAFQASASPLPSGLALPYEEFSTLTSDSAPDGSEAASFEPFQLPLISLPPETDEDSPDQRVSAESPEDADFTKEPVGYRGVKAYLAFFADDTVPERDTNSGIFLRQLVHDIIDVYEVNRKVCARILLIDLQKWLPNGTFKSSTASSSSNGNGSMVVDTSGGEQSPIMVENTIMEIILSNLFATPFAPAKHIYYHSLIGELCRISPQTVAPALGKCIRKLYAGLGKDPAAAQAEEGTIVLGAEGIRRYAQWFAVHLSNFGFHWRWPEWESDLSLPAAHPKKVFIARTLELEIRLSYYDRIKSTLPESYLDASALVLPEDAPGPYYTYEMEQSNPNSYQTPANEVLKAMRGRATVAEIKEMLDAYKNDAIAGEIGDEPIDEESADRLAKDIFYQSMLSVGSRSFSHFLNILERYITILREFTNSAASRLALLRSVSRFWATNSQFNQIVFDKLLQYRIVDPIDVVGWVFGGEQPLLDGEVQPRNWADLNTWDILRLTLEKVQTRVAATTARVAALRKREENRMDAERAAGAEVPEGEETAAAAAAEVAAAERLLGNVKQEQQALIVEVVRQFHATISAQENDGEVDEWQKWFTLGFFAEFCRAFAKDLSKHLDALAHVDLPAESTVYMGLAAAHTWVETV